MTTQKLSKRAIARQHVHNRILIQLLLFVVVAIGMFGFVMYDTVTQNVNPLWLVGGAGAGLVVGWITGRIFSIQWHQDTQKVIASLDRTGIILLVAYFAFRTLSTTLFTEFSHGVTFTVLAYSLVGGILVGRGLNLYKNVVTILQDQKIL